ncbi:MAG: hypothetical protein Kow0098_04630 [Ignavibacteriaceae bacterium]
MKTLISAAAFILLFFASNNIFGQNVFSECPDYTIDISKTGTQPTVTQGGLKQIINCNPLYVYEIGKNGSTRKRGIYQWNISDIPDGSIINSITLEFSFSVIIYTECNLKYFNVGTDITSPNLNLEDLYNATHYDQTGIGYGFGGPSTNYVISTTFTDPGDPFIIAFTNALNQDRFTLGAAWRYDGPTAGDAEWNVTPRVPTIIVNYAPPSQLVTIDQRNSLNQQVGVLRKWEGTQFTDPPFNPGSSFYFPVSSDQTILGDQTIISNQKYNKWVRNSVNESNVINHHSFTIQSFDNNFTSRFEPTQSGITIKNSLEGTTIDGGAVEFRDPWFIDYPDPNFANQLRNRGMDNALFYSRTSPFYPDYTTSYNGLTYKGVFLNQDYNIPCNPYYKVKSPAYQDINLGGEIGTRRFYFQNWSGTGVSFQDDNSTETGVVFTNSDAVVNANLKGASLSDNSSAFNKNGQRKFVRTDDGTFHYVYESMGRVWYKINTENGTT